MKKALVTGGSGDIGQAICQRLATDGYHVIVHAHSRPERANTLVGSIRASGGSAEVVVFDVTDTGDARTRLEGLLAAGPIQTVVCNAGIHRDAPLAGMDYAAWREVIDVSLDGFYNVVHPLLLPMMGTRWGRVIAMSSVAGIMGNRGQANYAAAKAGLIGAVKSLAIELASRGVTANVVAPGVIAGDMTEGAFGAERIKTIVPMKRAGRPDEVASLVSFLASDEASYISGQAISINGAMT